MNWLTPTLLALSLLCSIQQQIYRFHRTNKNRKTYRSTRRLLHALILPLLISMLMSACTAPSQAPIRHNGTSPSKTEEQVGESVDESTKPPIPNEVHNTREQDSSSGEAEISSDETGHDSSTSEGSYEDNSLTESSEDEGPKQVPDDSDPLEVHFLDVGQGASVLFRQGDYTMLMDGGDKERSSFVVSYLKNQGIKTIDVMIASHYDADHINGLVGALHAFDVDVVYSADYVGMSKVYQSFKSAVEQKADREIGPKIGQIFELGDMRVTFIAPRQYSSKQTANDNSISIRVDYGSNSFVIMGDQSANSEQQMLGGLDLKADVYYSSHHGSNGSNSKTLLDAVSPKWVVISSGSNNSYGHPGANTLSRVRQTGARLFRTDQQGTVIVSCNGTDYEWSTAPSDDFTSGPSGKSATPTPAPTTKSTTAPTSAPTTSTTAPTPVLTTAGTTTPTTTGSTAPTTTATAQTASPQTTAAPPAAVVTTAPPATTTAPPVPVDISYVVNTNTKKFHLPSCRYVKEIHAQNRLDSHDSHDSITSQGYVPCKVCNP